MFSTVIFDWKRTLYDPDRKVLIDGAMELLSFIKKRNIPMILIGKGGEEMQREVKRLGVGNYFRQLVFVEGNKDPVAFLPFISQDNPKRTLIIGDRVRSELEIGRQLGVTTIWIKQGKFAAELPKNNSQKPDYIAGSLVECLDVISRSLSNI